MPKISLWRLRRRARRYSRSVRRLLKRKGKRKGLSPQAVTEVSGCAARVLKACEGSSKERISAAVSTLDEAVEQHLPWARKSTWREYLESIGLAVAIALAIRSFVIEPFKIPSGSMIPTLKVGDHIFVNKFTYGPRIPYTFTRLYHGRMPQRGEVVVFINPEKEDQDYIKRVVALPGDTVELRRNQLHVNGEEVKRSYRGSFAYWDKESGHETHASLFDENLDDTNHQIIHFHDQISVCGLNLPPTAQDRCGPITVEPGKVFVMGDNRDNSQDSRVIGQIPIDHIKGKAMFIWWSRGKPDGVRWGRFFKGIE